MSCDESPSYELFRIRELENQVDELTSKLQKAMNAIVALNNELKRIQKKGK